MNLIGLSILNGNVSDTAENGGGENGGGLLNSSGANITIRDSFIENNTAGNGGGIYNNGNGGKITLISTEIIQNVAVFDGGGIFNTSNPGGGGTITLINSSVSENTADDGGVVGVMEIVFYNSDGGGIFNSGASSTVNIMHSSVQDNTATGNVLSGGGGGIYNGTNASVNVEYSTISGNLASTGAGGAFDNQGSGKLKINSSMLIYNSAYKGGGGVYNLGTGSNVSVLNSSIIGNSSNSSGGGFLNKTSGLINLSNATVTRNTAVTTGAGIQNERSATTRVRNSIFLDNCTNTATLTTDGYNIEAGTSCGFTATGDQQNVTSTVVNDPSDDGGYTETMGLATGSVAINAGNPAGCVDENGVPVIGDQRGYERPSNFDGDVRCDIGAYEYNSQGPYLTVINDAIDALYTVSPTQFAVIFEQDLYAPDATNIKSAINPNNWLLLNLGINETLDTQTCIQGVIGDDESLEISSVTYNSNTYTATVNLDTGLGTGLYALIPCATTSIYETTSYVMLNAGEEDNPIEFEVSVSDPTPPPAPEPGSGDTTREEKSLPDTGFAQGSVVTLPEQSREKEYSSTSMSLSIPSLNVRTEIVGVPQTSGGWDVTWLGNQLGWLQGTAYPTWEGNTVLTGHVWDAFNQPGIFANLKSLAKGDRIELNANGHTYVYEVRDSVLRWSSEDFSTVIKHKETDWLTLITCEGYMPSGQSYLFRRVVGAELVAIQ